jgi:hypothetical protein
MNMRGKPASAAPLSVYFDLAHQGQWYLREWERLLGAGNPSTLRIAADEKHADCTLSPESPWQFGTGRSLLAYSPSAGPSPRFVWDLGDRPTGFEPGLYCSLPRPLFDGRRHRTFCYPIFSNELVGPNDLGDATLLFGFVGAISSGLRARMIESLRTRGRSDEMLVAVQAGPWDAMFGSGGLAIKRDYAAALGRCRFFLCPRGNGVGTVRLFETMRAARVPVILSDDYVLPAGIDWDNCSVRVPEKELAGLPQLLRERNGDWTRLATNARAVWESHFSPEKILDRIACHLRELLCSWRPLTPAARARVLAYPAYGRIRSGLTRLRQTARA